MGEDKGEQRYACLKSSRNVFILIPIIIRFLADGENVHRVPAGERHWVLQATEHAEKAAAFIPGR